ncbi:DUF3224 domain-containing protein [Dyella silvatica]|uniref:DUF3224 domain-containing protein n=1 Tax=Dyella silvatica TaxID=2992128 RepID=UPI002251BFFD|nr:DUF3224 domain-containing protein [Dyella silvatica]
MAALGLMFGLLVSAPSMSKEATTMHASGPFEVKLTPQPAIPGIEPARVDARTIDKQFHGELEAHSLGEMLSAGGEVPGSAGYVAIERVTGTLHGRHGSFLLQHSGTMNRGEPQLAIHVIPDSGTEQLTGLTGSMAIIIEHGQHSYTFDYQLP